MSQSRGMSLAEALTNTAIGFLVALVTQVSAYSALGMKATPAQHIAVVSIFTFVSVVRSYVLRRVFNNIKQRGNTA